MRDDLYEWGSAVEYTLRICGRRNIPRLRTTHTKCTLRVALVCDGKLVTTSCRYDIECVMPMPPATRSKVPYELKEWIPPAMILLAQRPNIGSWYIKPKGPSANTIALIRPSGDSSTLRRSCLVNPSFPLIRTDMLVLCDPSSRVAIESLELRFSLKFDDPDAPVDVQATVKGCDVHRPAQGMYKYMYWPGRKRHARDTATSTRVTEPGRASAVAVVGRLPQFLQMSIPTRPARYEG